MATALQNGEIDVAASTQPDATAADTLKSLTSQGVTYASAPQLTYEHLDLNLNREVFKDEAARKAFFQVVDREEIVNKLLKPVQEDAEPLGSIVFFTGEEGYEDRYSDKMGQGPEAAMKTLEEGGWKKGEDGIYEKDGVRFSVSISHNENERRSQMVEIIQSQAQAAGIEVRTTRPELPQGRRWGDYDIALRPRRSRPAEVPHHRRWAELAGLSGRRSTRPTRRRLGDLGGGSGHYIAADEASGELRDDPAVRNAVDVGFRN